MKYLWRLLVKAWLAHPIRRRDMWDEEDRATLLLFLESKCGKRFVEKLRQTAADVSFASVYAPYKQSVSAAAYARGWQDSLSLVYRLAASFPQGVESEYGVDGEEMNIPPQGNSSVTQRRWSGQIGGGSAL